MINNNYIQLYITLFKKAFLASWFFIFIGILANILNLVFNIYLGRVLTSNEYALIAFFVSVLYVASIFFNAIINTINHGLSHSPLSRNSIYQVVYVGAIVSFLWMIFSPVISHLFHIGELLPIILFSPVFTVGVIIAYRKGILRNGFHFQTLGVLFFLETLLKLLIAIILIKTNLEIWTYLAIPISILLICLITLFIPASKIPSDGTSNFPVSFFLFSLLTGLSTIAFLSLDILLVKLYFPPKIAGQYALLTLSGKMLYFLGSILNDFTIPLVAQEKNGKNGAKHLIYILFVGMITLTLAGTFFFLLFGHSFLMFLFGEKISLIFPLLTKYILAIAMFTISTSIVLYHLAKKQYIFSIIAISSSFLFLLGIFIRHNSLEDVVMIFLIVSTLNFLSMIGMMIKKSYRIKTS